MRKPQLYIAITGVALLALLYLAKRIPMILDPLSNSDLSDDERLVFRYLLTVYELSQVPLYDIPKDAESVRIFCTISRVGYCKECAAIYIDLDGICPQHHLLAKVDRETFKDRVLQWEELRKAYCKHIKMQTMTRIQAIKMYRMLKHPLER
jgi:hypothetical protein